MYLTIQCTLFYTVGAANATPSFFLPAYRGIPARLQGLSKSSVKNIQCRIDILVHFKTANLTLIHPNGKRQFLKGFRTVAGTKLRCVFWFDFLHLPTGILSLVSQYFQKYFPVRFES